jgi:hypothetical protein
MPQRGQVPAAAARMSGCIGQPNAGGFCPLARQAGKARKTAAQITARMRRLVIRKVYTPPHAPTRAARVAFR